MIWSFAVNNDVTQILSKAQLGDSCAAEQLLPLVYDELRRLAALRMAHEKGQTLQPTALVHEVYLRLLGAATADANGAPPPQWTGRGHFFAAAAEAMRRILVERARRVGRIRHGGGRQHVSLDAVESAHLPLADPATAHDEDLLALDDALARLDAEDPAAAAVVKLRYFTGLGVDETAAALDISPRTAKRHWAYAKAWLYQRLNGQGDATDR